MTNNDKYIYIYNFDELGVPHAHPGGPQRESLNWQGWPFRKRTVPLLRSANHMQLAPQSEFLRVLAGPSIQQLVWLVALLPFWSFTINTHESPQCIMVETTPQSANAGGIAASKASSNIAMNWTSSIVTWSRWLVQKPHIDSIQANEESLQPHGLFPKVDVSDARSPHLDEFDHDFTSWRHLNDG